MASFAWDGPALGHLPGHRAATELKDLGLAREIFDHAVAGLTKTIAEFMQHSSTPGFRARATRQEYEMRVLAVQSALFYAAASATAFKERAKVLNERLTVPDFQKEADANFRKSERYQFIQALRNHLSHVAPLAAEWHLSQSQRGAPQVARFLLRPDKLDGIVPRQEPMKSLTRAFIDNHRGDHSGTPGGGRGAIDIVVLFETYQADVHRFYGWLEAEVERVVGSELQDYRDTRERFYRVVARMGWRAVTWPSISQSPNPRTMVDWHLTPGEIARVDALPASSREQIDQIIEFLDAAGHGFFDEALRAEVYRRFGV